MQLDLPFGDAPPELYFVRNRRARRYLLRIDGDGRVRVTIPRGGSRRAASAFAERHQAWVERQLARIPPARFTEAERGILRTRASRELPARVRSLADAFGLTLTRVSVRNQRSRWGSCGRDGHICLNWRLILMPDWVRDYVLVHELMHLVHLNHSPRYWKLVAARCPDHVAARQWLRQHGRTLA
jgi:predicted metal-dependent hydrolase